MTLCFTPSQPETSKRCWEGEGIVSNSFHPKDTDRTRHLDTRKGILRGRKGGLGVAGDTPNSKQQQPTFSFFVWFVSSTYGLVLVRKGRAGVAA